MTTNTPLPQFVTFTGIDVRTDVAAAKRLSHHYPVEWGVLFGGILGTNRYPPRDMAPSLRGMRMSAHLCGRYSRYVMSQGLMHPDLPHSNYFARIQVNARMYNIARMVDFMFVTNKPVVMQVRSHFPPPDIIQSLTPMYDRSGGKGVVSNYWPTQAITTQMVGYAGGINPTNVLDVIRKINAVNYYLDMESGVRNEHDWLDVAKCEAVCKAIWG